MATKRINLSFSMDREDDTRVYNILSAQKYKTDYVIKVKSLNPGLYKVVYIPISTLTVMDFYRHLSDGLGFVSPDPGIHSNQLAPKKNRLYFKNYYKD